MRLTTVRVAYALLLLCAGARLMLQMAALPPYAGLDEVYHVARLAFVRAEHRNPTTREPSIPPYLVESHETTSTRAMPSMGEARERWPIIVRERGRHIVSERPLAPSDLEPYVVKNYEAQQTSLYYSLVAPLAPVKSALFELRTWRGLSLLFALVTVLATADIGRRLVGPIGILAGAILVILPTWETLVVRAGNDAFACMLVAVAVAITVAGPRKPVGIVTECVIWALALNVKMYTWPLLVVFPIFWWRQRGSRVRILAVGSASLLAIILTFAELSSRTSNPLGVVAFDRPGGVSYAAKVDVSEIVRVTIASAAWTSGQHNDALRPLAIALYLGPLLIAMVFTFRRAGVSCSPAFFALGAFALAQIYNVIACVLANRGGNPIPIGGKEGWYWYVLAPLVVPLLFMPVAARWRAAAWWLVVWDVVITEGALFHDFAGTTSPDAGSLLFRWGPLHPPFTAHLGDIGVGPFASSTTFLRLLFLAAFFGLESYLQRMRRDDADIDDANANGRTTQRTDSGSGTRRHGIGGAALRAVAGVASLVPAGRSRRVGT